MNDMSRAAEYLKKTNFLLPLSLLFFPLQTRATSTLAKMTTVAQMFYLMFRASRASGRERVIQRGEGPRENRENKWQYERERGREKGESESK